MWTAVKPAWAPKKAARASYFDKIWENAVFNRELSTGNTTAIVVAAGSDGTAAAPFLKRSATNDGLFFASGVIGLAIGGAELGRVTSSGIFFADNKTIGVNTADGSDNAVLSLSGGGASSSTRGSRIVVFGNEYASVGGQLTLEAGDVSTGHIIFNAHNAERMRLTYSGNLLFPSGAAIGINTADGSDNGYLLIGGGGGGGGYNRGGGLQFFGNEYASIGGSVFVDGGVVSTAYIMMRTGASTSDRFKIANDGQIYAYSIHNNGGTGSAANPQIAGGTYTPTMANGLNVASSIVHTFFWTRLGNIVSVRGSLSFNLTTNPSRTTFTLTLPVSFSYAGNNADIAGSIQAWNYSSATRGVDIVRATTGPLAYIDMYCSLSGAEWTVEFSYEVK